MIYLDNFSLKNFTVQSYNTGERYVYNTILLDKNSGNLGYNILYYSGSQEITVYLPAQSVNVIATGTMEAVYTALIANSDINNAGVVVSFELSWNGHTKALRFTAPLTEEVSVRLRRSNIQSMTQCLSFESTVNNGLITENDFTYTLDGGHYDLTPHAKSTFYWNSNRGTSLSSTTVQINGNSTLYVYTDNTWGTLLGTFTGDETAISAAFNASALYVVGSWYMTGGATLDIYTQSPYNVRAYKLLRTNEDVTFTMSDTYDLLFTDQDINHPGTHDIYTFDSNHGGLPTSGSSATKHYDTMFGLYPLGANDSSVAEDATSQLIYGKRIYTLKNEDIFGNVDKVDLLNNKLAELKDPKARMVVHVPFNYPGIDLLTTIEVRLRYQNVDKNWSFTEGGVYLSWADSDTYRYKQFLVTGIRHGQSGDYTSLTLMEKI